jgi:hypothetical protein
MKMNSENIPPSSKENVSSQQSTRIEMPSKTQHNQKIGINKIGQLQRFRMNIPYYIALITTKRRTMPYIIVVGCIGVVALNTLMLHYIYGPGHPITWFRLVYKFSLKKFINFYFTNIKKPTF